MIRNPELLVSELGLPKSCDILHQLFLLAWFQDHRIQHSRRIAQYIVPTVVVRVQVRLRASTPEMTLHHIVYEVLDENPLSSGRSERERLNAPAGPFTSILLARKPHLKGSATISEPVFPGAGIIVQRSVEVNSTNSFQEALLQKPF